MNIIGNVARVISFWCEASELKDSIHKISQETTLSGKLLRLSDSAAKAVALGCRTVCAVKKVSGAKPQELQRLKGMERTARIVDLGATLFTVSKDCEIAAAHDPFKGSLFRVVNLFERVARPLVSLARVNAEFSAYGEQIGLDATVKNENGPSPLIKYQANQVNGYISAGHNRAFVESFLQVNSLSILAIIHEVMRERAIQVDRDEQLALHADSDPTNLLALSFIPASLHEDEVFKQHICPITLMPIRYPVAEPGSPHIYERSAIERALENDSRSPLTRNPLRKEDLIPQEDIQRAIDDRLRLYQSLFQQRIDDLLHNQGDV